jgi:hypothetical protein
VLRPLWAEVLTDVLPDGWDRISQSTRSHRRRQSVSWTSLYHTKPHKRVKTPGEQRVITSKLAFDRRVIPKNEIVEHGHQSGLAHSCPRKNPRVTQFIGGPSTETRNERSTGQQHRRGRGCSIRAGSGFMGGEGESESTESTTGEIRATRRMQLDAYGGHAGKS